jgi:hypothetical protein
MALTAKQRRPQARAASHASWAKTVDHSTRTAPARAALNARLEADLINSVGADIWAEIPPAQQAKMIDNGGAPPEP